MQNEEQVSPFEYFSNPQSNAQRQYCALTAYFKDGIPAKNVAEQYGYTISAFYALVRDFKARLECTHKGKATDPFFRLIQPGRKSKRGDNGFTRLIVLLRREGMSNNQIAQAARLADYNASETTVWRVLKSAGFPKLSRRTRISQAQSETTLEAIREEGAKVPVLPMLSSNPLTLETEESNETH